MADATVRLEWTGSGHHFRGGRPGGPVADVDGDGQAGPSPMQTLLISLGGCTAADVLDILRKMRIEPTSFDVLVEGDRKPDPPRRYTRLRLVYTLEGVGEEDEAKVRRAVDLSHEKYCSVLHSLQPDIEIGTEIVLR